MSFSIPVPLAPLGDHIPKRLFAAASTLAAVSFASHLEYIESD
jgi:hypothetical protein